MYVKIWSWINYGSFTKIWDTYLWDVIGHCLQIPSWHYESLPRENLLAPFSKSILYNNFKVSFSLQSGFLTNSILILIEVKKTHLFWSKRLKYLKVKLRMHERSRNSKSHKFPTTTHPSIRPKMVTW